jgi:alkylation response protein AidB-like acyl-CoA dehydrogenase
MENNFMTIDSTEEIKLIRESAKNFAEKNIRPYLMDWDESQYFPKDLFQKMGEQGFMGVVVPEEYGGTGLNYQAYITIIEEIAKVCSSIGLSLAAHNSLGTNHIYMFGSEEQKMKYLPKLASGEQ